MRRTERHNPALVAEVLAIRARRADQQAAEEVRISTMSPLQIAEKEMRDAREVRDRAEIALIDAEEAFRKAEDAYKTAHRGYLSMQRRGR